MRLTCWITEATKTHSEYVTLTAFPLQKKGYAKAPEYYVTSTLTQLFESCVCVIYCLSN